MSVFIWKRRFYCQNHNNGWVRYLYLILLRRTENKMCADTGLGLNTVESPMCHIESPLNLPHRLNGIIIGRNASIGRNVTIYQNVTIAECGPSASTRIEDNVMIGVGTVIVRNVTIGKGAKIEANSVILNDIPRWLLATRQGSLPNISLIVKYKFYDKFFRLNVGLSER